MDVELSVTKLIELTRTIVSFPDTIVLQHVTAIRRWRTIFVPSGKVVLIIMNATLAWYF